MKNKVLNFCLALVLYGTVNAQCVPNCTNYAVSAIAFTTFPSAGTNPISTFSPNTDDGVTPLIPLGFSFNFYCTTYTDIRICTNGFLQFNNGVPAVASGFADPTQSFPSSTAPNAMVALHMNDLDAGAGGTITYTTIGTTPNQKFILTYTNVPLYGYSTSLNSGQIVLYETTNIIEIYTGNVNNGSTTYGTQGIEDAIGSMGVTAPNRNNVIWNATNSAYQFAPYTPAPPTSVTGNSTLCQGDIGIYQSSIMVGASAYNWSFPAGWTGSSTISAISATAGASGNVSVSATYTCGTSNATTLAVNVMPAPIVSLSATPPIICSGKVISFNTTGAVTYTLNPGGINGTPPLTDIASVSTTYTLIGTDANGCVSQNDPTAFITVKQSPTVTVNSGTVCNGQTFYFTPSGAITYTLPSVFGSVSPTVAGTYTYPIVGSANGCVSDTAVSNLTVYALPTVTAAASRTAMCLKESVVLSSGGASSYTWNTNATTNTISVSPNSTTNYTVTATDIHGCINTATVTVTLKNCVGITEMYSSNSEISIYPNPGKGMVHVKMDNLTESSVLEIYNSIGQIILTQKIVNETFDVDLSSYANGLYYFSVKDSNSKQLIKLVKE